MHTAVDILLVAPLIAASLLAWLGLVLPVNEYAATMPDVRPPIPDCDLLVRELFVLPGTVMVVLLAPLTVRFRCRPRVVLMFGLLFAAFTLSLMVCRIPQWVREVERSEAVCSP